MTTPAVTFLTPTYKRDYERFCLQRESMERCRITIPHVAIVNHEDMAVFRDVPYRDNLTILSTRDVLPPRIEARRKAWGCRRRELRHWIDRPAIHGWMLQQLLKLAAPAVVQTEGIICLDSDTFFVDTVTPDDFYGPDGRLHLYETEDDLDAEMAEWYILSLRFLGVDLRDQPLRRYIHSPVPFHRQVVLDMQNYIQERHHQHWMEAMVRGTMIFEYMTYGVYARYRDALQNVVPTRPPLSLYYWFPHHMATIQQDFLSRLGETNAKMVLINSNIGFSVSEYRALIEQAWSQPQVIFR